ARVYFRPEGTPSWYYVDNWGRRMPHAQSTCLQTTLPKAKKSLLNKHVEYYVEAVGKSMGETQSAPYTPLVVTSESECKDKKAAAVLPGPIGNVLPAVPAGFAVGAGISAGTIAAVVGAGVVGAGVGVAAGGGSNNPSAPTTVSSPTTTAPPVTTVPPASTTTL